MAAPIIRVENLGKRYRIRHQSGRGSGYRRLSEDLWNAARAPFMQAGRRRASQQTVETARASSEDFWALRNVSFDVKQGEVLGIIGRNGAGKSTLLKVLSRITEPTEGRVRIRGRLASLLEVGTGFHPELTGRENIFLNGAIVGMTRAEIKRKFDEIVAFAEVDKFLDTPVKRYSSGMYVRLAFAVAAHLEPEILVIDEVLAVGDAQFQKKCLGRMSEVAAGGRTVLFVSHNLAAIQALCSSALLLRRGKDCEYGDVQTLIADYQADACRLDSRDGAGGVSLFGGVILESFTCTPRSTYATGPATFELEFSSTTSARLDHICMLVYSVLDVRVGVIDLRLPSHPLVIEPSAPARVMCQLDRLNLVEGEYRLGLYVSSVDGQRDVHDLLRISVGPRPAANGLVPFASRFCGFVEFDYQTRHLSVNGNK